MTDRKLVQNNDDIDVSVLIKILWKGKLLIFLVTSAFTIISAIYAITLPNIYKSEVVLSPVSEQGGVQIGGQLGGLAALAGVSLGSSAGGDKTALALELLKSRDFVSRFIESNNLYVPIMAAVGWDRINNKLIINSDYYNEENSSWIREVDPPFFAKPSNQESFEEFKKIYSVNHDKTNGTVTIAVEHYSPYVARDWVDILVKRINEEIRQQDLSEAQRSINYLNAKIKETNLADVKVVLYSLVEEQTKKIMLANIRPEYVFKTIDPPVVAELEVKPKRVLIVFLAFILSLFAGCVVQIVKYSNKSKKL